VRRQFGRSGASQDAATKGRIVDAHLTASEGGAMQAEETQSLYDRLGGVYVIAVVVDDFIDRIMSDPRLNANPRVDEAHHRVTPQGFKYYVTEQICWAAGGPQTYSGRSMFDTHRELLITGQEWDAFMDDLDQTLTQFDVPERERGELVAIVESTKDDIVTSTAPAV
jgi:hemoglobin